MKWVFEGDVVEVIDHTQITAVGKQYHVTHGSRVFRNAAGKYECYIVVDGDSHGTTLFHDEIKVVSRGSGLLKFLGI